MSQFIPLKELHYVKMSITLSGQIVGEQMHTAYCILDAYWPVHAMMLSIQEIIGLPRFLTPSIKASHHAGFDVVVMISLVRTATGDLTTLQ